MARQRQQNSIQAITALASLCVLVIWVFRKGSFRLFGIETVLLLVVVAAAASFSLYWRRQNRRPAPAEPKVHDLSRCPKHDLPAVEKTLFDAAAGGLPYKIELVGQMGQRRIYNLTTEKSVIHLVCKYPLPDAPVTPIAAEPPLVVHTRLHASTTASSDVSLPLEYEDYDTWLLEWRGWGQLVKLWLETIKGTAEVSGFGPDGGVDVQWTYDGQLRVVQVKAREGRAGVAFIREAVGVLRLQRAVEAVVVSKAGFTADAQREAQILGIRLYTGDEVIDGLSQLPVATQAAIQARVFDVEWQIPTCSRCGIKMVHRQKKDGSGAFWGCVHFPQCTQILNIPTTQGRALWWKRHR